MQRSIVVFAVIAGLAVVVLAEVPQPTEEMAEMVLIPAGEYMMGREGEGDYSPPHQVKVDSFYLDAYEVTNQQYYDFCLATEHDLPEFWGMEEFHCGSDFPDYPVVGISWWDASDYAEWAGKRLPTEAEWEYAARGGHLDFKFPWGNDVDSTKMNFKSDGSRPMGSYPPNGYGLYEMTGNIWEWVGDYYNEDYYDTIPQVNPTGPEAGRFRTIRGGSWHSGPGCVNVYHRNGLPSHWVDFAVGFRCARDTE